MAAGAVGTDRAPPLPRRGWRWALLGVVALLAIFALAAGWLLGSGGGRDLAFGQLMAALPEGALRIGEREGSLAGGLRLRLSFIARLSESRPRAGCRSQKPSPLRAAPCAPPQR